MPENAPAARASEPPITPMPVPPGTPLVVVFGGTFDPPHRAHVELALRALGELERLHACPGRGYLVIVPAARSPFKGEGPVAADAQRAEMLRLALAARPRAGVWTDEIDRAAVNPLAPSYTLDTLARARHWLDQNACGAAVLRLLLGADQALAFHRWREPGRVIQLAEPGVLLRLPTPSRDSFHSAMRATGAWTDPALAAWERRVLDVGLVDAAATDVRQFLADPAAHAEDLRRLLHPGVLDYIKAHRLYQVPPASPALPAPPVPAPAPTPPPRPGPA